MPRAWARKACCDVVNRGAAVWKGRVYVGTLDGRLVALDAGTGEPVWDVNTIDREQPYTITGAPRIVKGKVIIGNGGAEYGVRGYVTAYDAETGEQVWRFYTVPGDPAKPFESRAMAIAAKTWRGGNWWEIGGGGTVWDSMAYDPELNLLYIGVGNGSPWNRYIRSPGGGDNLFVASIVALNPDNGTMTWYYQTTPGDTWDYTATQHMILADIEIGGNPRKVIMQAPKNGFFYVLDRIDGELISAEAYVPVNWASHVDLESGRPVENPGAHYLNEPKRIHPGPLGGHNWHPMTYSPITGLVYMPTLETELRYGQDEQFEYNPATWNTGVEFGGDGADFVPKGHLTAWDPVRQSAAWRIDHAGPWNGGLLSTAGGLVFQGRADCTFAAYRASDGELLWRMPTGNGIVAAPVTYEIDDAQFIVVIAGWGGAFGLTRNVPCNQGTRVTAGRILAYTLGGTAQLPASEPSRPPPEPPPQRATAQVVAAGEALFRTHCGHCHGASTDGGVIPSLRHMTPETHAAWDAIVRDGVYVRKGMIGFGDVLDEKQSAAIHAYVIDAAQE